MLINFIASCFVCSMSFHFWNVLNRHGLALVEVLHNQSFTRSNVWKAMVMQHLINMWLLNISQYDENDDDYLVKPDISNHLNESNLHEAAPVHTVNMTVSEYTHALTHHSQTKPHAHCSIVHVCVGHWYPWLPVRYLMPSSSSDSRRKNKIPLRILLTEQRHVRILIKTAPCYSKRGDSFLQEKS